MIITNQIVIVKDVIPVVQTQAREIFAGVGIQDNFIDREIAKGLSGYLDKLKDTLWVCVESPYVDRIYRDSYYHYYASKLGSYPKDCIRLSFFDVLVEERHFRTEEHRAFLQDHFMGFLVIRPTLRSPVGRNVISPKALRQTDIQVCQTIYSVTVNSIKLTISGFPHSSQDVETITCAQTTLWAIMEYFSQRYADYRPALPSTITKRLENLSVERQMPATGLSIEQISFALKEFGFGPRIYHRANYVDDFDDLFSCYVESGIPIVVAIQNKSFGHALLCIGRQTVHGSSLNNSNLQNINTPYGTLILKDSDRFQKDFIFIDDNLPPYARATLNDPAANYVHQDWRACTVVALLVPLYKKVYLEAFEAKKYIKSLFTSGLIVVKDNQMVTMRFFLTSSRSYKNRVATDPIMTDIVKETIVSTSLPKFIWVGELTDDHLFQQNEVNGVVLIDATEADTMNHKPLIMLVFNDRIINFATLDLNRRLLTVPTGTFTAYQNNLA